MNTKAIYALMGAISILTVARVDAATIFSANGGEVNFQFSIPRGVTLAMFDDSDQTYLGDSIILPKPSVVTITGPDNSNGDHTATRASQTLTLTGSDNFTLGLNLGGIWLADTSVVATGVNSYRVIFGDDGRDPVLVDIQNVQIVSAVPLPAAVWLFASGLLGLAGGCYKKKSSHRG